MEFILNISRLSNSLRVLWVQGTRVDVESTAPTSWPADWRQKSPCEGGCKDQSSVRWVESQKEDNKWGTIAIQSLFCCFWFLLYKCVLFLIMLSESWRRRRRWRGGPRWRNKEEGSNCQRCYWWIDAGICCRTQRTFTGWGLPAAKEKKGEKGRGRLILMLLFFLQLSLIFTFF